MRKTTNEELTTVNDEMAHRNAELIRLNADLNNLQISIHTAILLFSRDLTLRRFTPLAGDLFNLLPTDLGRGIGGLRHNLEMPDLARLLVEALTAGTRASVRCGTRRGVGMICARSHTCSTTRSMASCLCSSRSICSSAATGDPGRTRLRRSDAAQPRLRLSLCSTQTCE
ncbi:MAG: PAS domain-containing protein [Chthoniobacterales bacterium]|nr:PAS domain-containing protein [Chthoniobacterales bacterium]